MMSDFEYLTHTEKRVLAILCRHWRFHNGGNSWSSFQKLSVTINRSLEETKKAVWSLRDQGFLSYAPMVDGDFRPCGSGYFLTSKIDRV